MSAPIHRLCGPPGQLTQATVACGAPDAALALALALEEESKP